MNGIWRFFAWLFRWKADGSRVEGNNPFGLVQVKPTCPRCFGAGAILKADGTELPCCDQVR